MTTTTSDAGKLTTHVLDTANGCPAKNLEIELFRIIDNQLVSLKKVQTNSDGRCDAPLLVDDEFEVGTYELHFNVAAYFERIEDNPFLQIVPVRFGISDQNAHYHVPLLVSPFGYSTYRGS